MEPDEYAGAIERLEPSRDRSKECDLMRIPRRRNASGLLYIGLGAEDH